MGFRSRLFGLSGRLRLSGSEGCAVRITVGRTEVVGVLILIIRVLILLRILIVRLLIGVLILLGIWIIGLLIRLLIGIGRLTIGILIRIVRVLIGLLLTVLCVLCAVGCAVRRLIGCAVGLIVRVVGIVGVCRIVLSCVFSKRAVRDAEHQNAGNSITEYQGEDRNAAKILAASSCAELYVRDDRNG